MATIIALITYTLKSGSGSDGRVLNIFEPCMSREIVVRCEDLRFMRRHGCIYKWAKDWEQSRCLCWPILLGPRKRGDSTLAFFLGQ